MDKKKPPRGQREGLVSMAADAQSFTAISPEKQTRRTFAVVITRGLWRGFTVTVEPRTINHQQRNFRDHDEAMTFARELAKLEGWPLLDLSDGAA